MKKTVLLAGLALSLCTSFKSEAQVRVNINIGTPVTQGWYANDDDYYYMPEQGVYYNVRRRAYVYPEGGGWMYANRLPPRSGDYCYANSHYQRVRARAPFYRNDYYRSQYGVAYNDHHGNYIHDHDRHNNGKHRGGNGNGNGNGNGHRDNRDWNNGNNGGHNHNRR